MKRIGVMLVLAWIGMPAGASADNTTCTGAIYVVPDGSVYSGTIAAGGEVRWYTFRAKANRSYAITVQNMMPGDVQNRIGFQYPFRNDCAGSPVTLAWSMDLSDVEPLARGATNEGGNRVSISVSTDTTVNIPVAPVTVSSSFQIHIEDTTLFSDWFFVGGDYNAFTLLRNTTAVPMNYAIQYRNSAGQAIGSFVGILPAHGSVYKNARDLPFVLTAMSGTLEIIHSGPADGVVASTTVMSPSTGLSFDAPFIRRVGR